MPIFNLAVPKAVTGVDSDVLMPSNSWKDQTKYTETVKKLATKFQKNFARYSKQIPQEVINAGPLL